MERVRLYDEKEIVGERRDWSVYWRVNGNLPVVASRRRWPLARSSAEENFVERVFALHELNRLRANGLTRHGLLNFHSRYKLQLLAHHQAGYREIGPFVASLHQWDDLDAFSLSIVKSS